MSNNTETTDMVDVKFDGIGMCRMYAFLNRGPNREVLEAGVAHESGVKIVYAADGSKCVVSNARGSSIELNSEELVSLSELFLLENLSRSAAK